MTRDLAAVPGGLLMAGLAGVGVLGLVSVVLVLVSESVSPLFAVIYQALTPGGTLLFSAEHPVYTAPLRQGWQNDDAGQKIWPVSHYQQEGERISNWFADGVKKQHRKLASWINLLVAAGFVIEHLDEWGPTAEQIAAQPGLDEEKERPMLFVPHARKPT